MKKHNIFKFPNFVDLEYKHMEQVLDIFARENICASEFDFTELFAWRKIAKIKIAAIDEGLCIAFDKKGEKFVSIPLCVEDRSAAMKKILEYYKKENDGTYIKPFPGGLIETLGEEKNDFIFEDDRDNYDYIYLTKNLAELQGRKYAGKRNHIKNFNSKYEYEFLPIDDNLIEEVIAFQKKWYVMKSCDDNISLQNENEAVMEILNNFKKLNVFGAVIKINKKVEAFTIASKMNSNMAVVIVEKADVKFKGIYQAINRLFCEKYLLKYKCVNRQQDTGDEGLKKAKLSYYPHHFIEKKKVRLKEK